MKLQLWTTVNGHPDEMLGEVDVDDEEWNNAQADGADAQQLIRDLAVEIDGGCTRHKNDHQTGRGAHSRGRQP